MIKDFLRLVYLSLRNRKLRSWLTMIGIFIGIAAVVSLIGLGEGLREAISSQFDVLAMDILAIQASGTFAGPPGTGVVNPLTEDLADGIEGIKGVDLVLGRLIEDAEIIFDGVKDFTYSVSIPDDNEKIKELMRIGQFEIEKGRMLEPGERNKAVIGKSYAEGDRFGKVIRLRDKIIVDGEGFEVVGILEKKGSFMVDNAVLLNEDIMREIYDINETFDIIAVKVATGVEMSKVKERIENYLRKERDVDKGEEDFSVESSEQSIKDLNSTIFAVQIFVYVIAAISIIVGGIGITNTMYTSVLERTKEIGVMKSIGAKNSSIFLLFFLESGFLGAVGGLIGIGLGVGFANLLAFGGRLALGTDLISVSMAPALLFGALLFSFLVGTIAGILPAMQASKLNPVDALQFTQ